MKLGRLEVVGIDGARVPYSGMIGPVLFGRGVSVGEQDLDYLPVRRVLDGTTKLRDYTVRRYDSRNPQGAAAPTPQTAEHPAAAPGPPPTPPPQPPAPPPPLSPADPSPPADAADESRKAWGAQMAEARRRKRESRGG